MTIKNDPFHHINGDGYVGGTQLGKVYCEYEDRRVTRSDAVCLPNGDYISKRGVALCTSNWVEATYEDDAMYGEIAAEIEKLQAMPWAKAIQHKELRNHTFATLATIHGH